MPNYQYPFGHRTSWVFDPNRPSIQKDLTSKRPVDEDSSIASSHKREISNAARRDRKYSAKELVEMLPDCGKVAKSIDDLCTDMLHIVSMLDDSKRMI